VDVRGHIRTLEELGLISRNCVCPPPVLDEGTQTVSGVVALRVGVHPVVAMGAGAFPAAATRDLNVLRLVNYGMHTP
jgi:hypothetical protein